MEWISRGSSQVEPQQILADLTRDMTPGFDLAFFFCSGLGKDVQIALTEQLKSLMNVRHILACSCSGIIEQAVEFEQQTGCSVMYARLEGVRVNPFYLDQSRLEELERSVDWYDTCDVFPNENPYFIILPDPFQIDVNRFLRGLNQAYPQRPVLGGLASGAAQSNGNVLMLNHQVYTEGLVGVALTGQIRIDTIVSQGCRPIGASYIVTKSEGNIIYALAGRPFYEVIVEEISKVPARDRALAQESLFVGIAMDEYKHSMGRGDFLIRLILGVDQKNGAGAVADHVKTGQTVQLHVRDKVSASEDLNALLKNYCGRQPEAHPSGALIFSCNGRGKNLFKEDSHDARTIRKYLGPVPAAGFFCAGEIGPVGGRNFIHGFTVSLGLFYPEAAP